MNPCEATRNGALIHDAPATLTRFRHCHAWSIAVCERHQRLRCVCGHVMEGEK